MYIKSYKLFLESLTNKYLDTKNFIYNYFIDFYDEGYDYLIFKGWLDDNRDFRLISNGNNRKLAYRIILTNKENSKVDLSERLLKGIEMIEEIEGLKLVRNYVENNIQNSKIELVFESDIICDMTIEDICEKYSFITKDIYIKCDKFLREKIENARKDTNHNITQWKDVKGCWIFLYDEETYTFHIDSDIWSLFELNTNLNYNQNRILILLLLDNIIRRKIVSIKIR